MKKCNCMPPPPPPACGPCPPPPVPPVPPVPDCNCPPKVYRNPTEVKVASNVVVRAGDHVTVDVEETDTDTIYTVNSTKYPVTLEEGESVLHGDGTPEHPLGAGMFVGATEETPGQPGAVPPPTANERNLYLRGDGTWAAPSTQDVPAFTGATENEPGTSGLVPAPAVADREKFLKGDGTWSSARVDIRGGEHINVSRDGDTYTIDAERFPVEIDQSSLGILGGDGTPEHPLSIAQLGGATADHAGTAGVAPTPQIADRDKFLKGDGTWAAVPESYTPIACSAQLMDTWLDAADAEDNTPEVNGNG